MPRKRRPDIETRRRITIVAPPKGFRIWKVLAVAEKGTYAMECRIIGAYQPKRTR